MSKLYHLDCFTGIGGFHLAAKRCGFETIMASEIDPFNIKLIDRNLGLDNCGDISLAVCNRAEHPHALLAEDDIVPVERTGLTSLCYEDFMEGVVPWPDIVSGGFPCQDVSPANTRGCSVGINGKRSGLVREQLRILDALEVPFAVFENSKNLRTRGLAEILMELDGMGYIVEFETISAVPFGYPHYRHRMFIVAYKPFTQIAAKGVRIFEQVKASLPSEPEFKIPLLKNNEAAIKSAAILSEPKSVELRSKRINGLGNSVIPDIVESIYKVIAEHEQTSYSDFLAPLSDSLDFKPGTPEFSRIQDGQWCSVERDLFGGVLVKGVKMPTNGIVYGGRLYSSNENDPVLNPSTRKYEGLYYTLGRKDGNNNGNPSRANRPGGLGGLNGQLGGALNPDWCELFMGYPQGHTELRTA